MSYDFHLFKPRAGEDPLVTARRGSRLDQNTPLNPKREAMKRKTADALVAHDPNLEIFQMDYEKIASFQKITVEQARLKFRHLELNGPEDDESGIQITLFDDEAAVAVPFWHEGKQAEESFRQIWNYLKIIHQETGFLVYDPQIDRVIDPASGYETALNCYTGVVRNFEKILPPAAKSEKPFWKLW